MVRKFAGAKAGEAGNRVSTRGGIIVNRRNRAIQDRDCRTMDRVVKRTTALASGRVWYAAMKTPPLERQFRSPLMPTVCNQ